MFSIPIHYNKSALEARIQQSFRGYVKCDLVVNDIDLELTSCAHKVRTYISLLVQLLYLGLF